jgi:hypothetical protein
VWKGTTSRVMVASRLKVCVWQMAAPVPEIMYMSYISVHSFAICLQERCR